MKPLHRLTSFCLVAMLAVLSGHAETLTKAPTFEDRDEPVILPIVKTANIEQPNRVTARGVREIASINSDFRSGDRPRPAQRPRPQVPDLRSFA